MRHKTQQQQQQQQPVAKMSTTWRAKAGRLATLKFAINMQSLFDTDFIHTSVCSVYTLSTFIGYMP